MSQSSEVVANIVDILEEFVRVETSAPEEGIRQRTVLRKGDSLWLDVTYTHGAKRRFVITTKEM